MNEPTSDIYFLIAKYSKGKITKEEYKELEEWLDEAPSNKKIFKQYLILLKNANRVSFMRGVNQKVAWEIISQKLERRAVPRFNRWFRYAAGILIILTLAISYEIYNRQQTVIAENTTIEPGEAKATLVLADGSQLNLESLKDSTIQTNEGANIEKKSQEISYLAAQPQEEVFNTLKVPRGGEYTLILSDGSKVWLNADSELTFPVKFVGDKREITLTGEAFLEVAENKEQPFIVHAQTASIEVLGTSFNVKAYSDENQVVSTLVKGSVRMSSDGDEVILHPGEQGATFHGETIKVQEVDTKLFTSWKDGMFIFRSLTLEEIMKNFERWYDVKVDFEKDILKQRRFTGKLRRYENINPHLELITLTTDVDFDIVNNRIIVKKK